jgi:hypothetical protein
MGNKKASCRALFKIATDGWLSEKIFQKITAHICLKLILFFMKIRKF